VQIHILFCDLKQCVEWKEQKYPIELKLKDSRASKSSTEQILKYMERTGSCKSRDEKIYMREEVVDGKKITVAGC